VREENRIEPSCSAAGSVDLVTWCTVCGETLSVINNALPQLSHKIVDGTCTVCGATVGDVTNKVIYVETNDSWADIKIEFMQLNEDGSLTTVSPGCISLFGMETDSPSVYKIEIPLYADAFRITSDEFDGIYEFTVSEVAENSTIYINAKIGDGNDLDDSGWIKKGLMK